MEQNDTTKSFTHLHPDEASNRKPVDAAPPLKPHQSSDSEAMAAAPERAYVTMRTARADQTEDVGHKP